MKKSKKAPEKMGAFISQPRSNTASVNDDVLDQRHMGIAVTSLTQEEQRRIEKLLAENFKPEQEQEGVDTAQHAEQIFRITSEIRSISAQSVLLHGERVAKAQNILKGYKSGAFTQWLLQTYGNRQTPYSMLKFYELHRALSTSNRLLLDKIPKKAAYQLAMRPGHQEVKERILQAYNGESQAIFIREIADKFPLQKSTSRKKPERKQLISDQKALFRLIENQRDVFTSEEKRELAEMGRMLQKIGEE